MGNCISGNRSGAPPVRDTNAPAQLPGSPPAGLQAAQATNRRAAGAAAAVPGELIQPPPRRHSNPASAAQRSTLAPGRTNSPVGDLGRPATADRPNDSATTGSPLAGRTPAEQDGLRPPSPASAAGQAPAPLSGSELLAHWHTWANEPGAPGENREEALRRMTDWLHQQKLDAPLDLTNLGLQSLPAYLPTGLQRLDVSHNQFQSLPDTLPDGLQSLYASHNQLQSLPEHLPAALQVLDASHNQLQSLPENLPDGLQGLEVSHNQLQSLPQHLPAGLQQLEVSQNQLQSLPEHLPAGLQQLYVNNNQLRSLPEHLPAPLVVLAVSHNQLSRLPERLPDDLEVLDVSYNQLQRLPEHLPDDLDVHGLETNPLLAGPQLQAGPQLHPLAWAVAAWPRPEGAPANEAEIAGHWQAFANEPGADAFTHFLRELANTVNARRSPDFRSSVGEWLCLLETRPELRQETFNASLSATDTCQDGASLTFNAMHQLRLASDVVLGQYDQRLPELIQLARGMFRLDELNTIARETAEWQESQGMAVDPVEVELAYQVKLRVPLGLLVDVNYPGRSATTILAGGSGE
jgi:hypothetical protein